MTITLKNQNGVSVGLDLLTQESANNPALYLENTPGLANNERVQVTTKSRINPRRDRIVKTIRLTLPTDVKVLDSDGVRKDALRANYVDVKVSRMSALSSDQLKYITNSVTSVLTNSI